MKRSIYILAVTLIAGVVLAQTEVKSVNVVGVNKYTFRSNSYNLLCVPFDAIDTGNANLLGIFGTNQLRSSDFAGSGDQVQIWNPSTVKWESYQLKLDNQYHVTTNFGGAAQNPSMSPGDGFWLRTAGAGSYKTQGLSLTLMGEVVDVITQLNDIVIGYQQVGYPFSSDIRIDQLDFVNDGARQSMFAGSADRISLWNGTNYQSFNLKDDGKWHSSTNFGGPAASNTISLGNGFWYVAKTNFVWSETNKYTQNLK